MLLLKNIIKPPLLLSWILNVLPLSDIFLLNVLPDLNCNWLLPSIITLLSNVLTPVIVWAVLSVTKCEVSGIVGLFLIKSTALLSLWFQSLCTCAAGIVGLFSKSS